MLVSGSLPPQRCGVGDYTAQLAATLAGQGDQVAVLTGVWGERPAVIDGVEILRGVDGWGVPATFRALRAIRRWRPELVHFQYPTANYGRWFIVPYLLPTLVFLLRIRQVMTWHEPFRILGLAPLPNNPGVLPNTLLPGGLILVRSNFAGLVAGWFRLTRKIKRVRYIRSAASIPPSGLDTAGRAALRQRLLDGRERLVVYFGFAYPNKGVEQLFDIVDPVRDRLVLACELDARQPYQQSLLQRLQEPAWQAAVRVTGFQPATVVADLLAVADAVVLPFPGGGGDWNTSILAVWQQGTLLLTTSLTRSGYCAAENTCYARPGDTAALRRALDTHAGAKIPVDPESFGWARVADEHRALYAEVVAA